MIAEYIEKIRNAVLGKDVKGAIADGLEQAYNDAIESGNVAAEVSVARGGYASLDARLDAEDSTIVEVEGKVDALQGNIIIASESEAESVTLSDGQILVVYEE